MTPDITSKRRQRPARRRDSLRGKGREIIGDAASLGDSTAAGNEVSDDGMAVASWARLSFASAYPQRAASSYTSTLLLKTLSYTSF